MRETARSPAAARNRSRDGMFRRPAAAPEHHDKIAIGLYLRVNCFTRPRCKIIGPNFISVVSGAHSFLGIFWVKENRFLKLKRKSANTIFRKILIDDVSMTDNTLEADFCKLFECVLYKCGKITGSRLKQYAYFQA